MLLGGFSAVVWLLSPSYHQSEWGCVHLGQLGHQVMRSLAQHTIYNVDMFPTWAVFLLRPVRQWASVFRSLGYTAPLQLRVLCGLGEGVLLYVGQEHQSNLAGIHFSIQDTTANVVLKHLQGFSTTHGNKCLHTIKVNK